MSIFNTLKVLEVCLSDFLDYDEAKSQPEFQWAEMKASFTHVGNGEDGIWSFLVPVWRLIEDPQKGTLIGDIPSSLIILVSKAVREDYAYILISNG